MKMMSPCKGCATRHPTCHADCERYNEWRAEDKRRKEIIQKNKHEILARENSYYARYEIQKKESAAKRTEKSKNGR